MPSVVSNVCIIFLYSFNSFFIHLIINLNVSIMKKLFTLLVLMACFLGAKAVEVVDAEVDFSNYSDISEWGFPYGWGGSESAKARLSIQDGCLHFESTEATDPTWDCQFFPIGFDGAETDVVYTVYFKIKGDHAENISLLGFGLTPYGQFPITEDWVEGTFVYEPSTKADGNLLMQCGGYVGTWDLAYLKITHEQAEGEQPITYKPNMVENGDAETAWTDEQANTLFTDTEKTINICAWSKERERNMNDDGGWDPFPADIEEDETEAGNHVFVCHGQPATTEGSASAWDNQFWIMSPKELKVGNTYKISFRYRASQDGVKTNTQEHSAQPSDYLHYEMLGDITFGTAWNKFDKEVTIPTPSNKAPIYSIAFNLNAEVKDAVDFFFDDLSIQEVDAEEGCFVAYKSANQTEYNFQASIALEEDPNDLGYFIGTVGTSSDWVTEVMISTMRGNSKVFKQGTIKPEKAVDVTTVETWMGYTEASNYKYQLPAGVWQIEVDTKSVNDGGHIVKFTQIEGESLAEPVDIVTNESELVIEGVERQYTEAEGANVEDLPEDIGTDTNPWGQAWDNQFWIMANRVVNDGEVTVVEFDYVATQDAKVTTQCHANAGGYIHWSAIGDVNFTTEEQHFYKEFTIPSECKDKNFQSIAFNMAEIKDANTYTIKNVKWYIKDEELNEAGQTIENLINEEGTDNFWVKIGAGTSPYIYGQAEPGVDGDANGDGGVDIGDIDYVIEYIGAEYNKAADVNNDNGVDIGDIDYIIDRVQ